MQLFKSNKKVHLAIIMYKISLKKIKSKGFHGIHEHEKTEGNFFITDVDLYIPYKKIEHIEQTIDYSIVAAIIKEELDIPTELLESLADRIVTRLMDNYSELTKVKLCIRKLQPDVVVQAKCSQVKLTRKR